MMTELSRVQVNLLASTATLLRQRGVITKGIDRAGVIYRTTGAGHTADQRPGTD
jgi:hypothetical protein